MVAEPDPLYSRGSPWLAWGRARSSKLKVAGSTPVARFEFSRSLRHLCEVRTNQPEKDPHSDYTLAQIAEMFDRSPQTVRDWIRSGQLHARRFNDREYRVTATALREFREGCRNGTSCQNNGEAVDLEAWKDVLAR